MRRYAVVRAEGDEIFSYEALFLEKEDAEKKAEEIRRLTPNPKRRERVKVIEVVHADLPENVIDDVVERWRAGNASDEEIGLLVESLIQSVQSRLWYSPDDSPHYVCVSTEDKEEILREMNEVITAAAKAALGVLLRRSFVPRGDDYEDEIFRGSH